MTTFTNSQRDVLAAPPEVYQPGRLSRSDTIQEETEKLPPLERSETMASVHFLLAHQPSRGHKPGHIAERKREHTIQIRDHECDLRLTYSALFAGLVNRPTVRQFIHEDRLFTEQHGRSLTQFEVRMSHGCTVSMLRYLFAAVCRSSFRGHRSRTFTIFRLLIF
jgi:hypothetical protein